jgi:hypothetical protein
MPREQSRKPAVQNPNPISERHRPRMTGIVMCSPGLAYCGWPGPRPRQWPQACVPDAPHDGQDAHAIGHASLSRALNPD